jgi:Transposase DDE domain
MAIKWYKQDKAAVVAALAHGEQPDLATGRGVTPYDELLTLHAELGVLTSLQQHISDNRQRQGLPHDLLLNTLAALPFFQPASLSGAATALFQEPSLLLMLGWSPVQIQHGGNQRHRHPQARQLESLPCHPDTLRDCLSRVTEDDWLALQRDYTAQLVQHKMLAGGVYAIDGSGLGEGVRLVCLLCVSTAQPIIVAWRVLTDNASEKGKEAHVTRSLIEQVVAAAGPGSIKLLLADALYADGGLLAWLKYQQGIAALVRLSEERELYADIQALASGGLLQWQAHDYVHKVRGHKQHRYVEVTASNGFTSWDSYVAAAQEYGAEADLWVGLVREVAPNVQAVGEAMALVSTQAWPSGAAALQAYRERWEIEDNLFHELKQGWQLEREQWGRARWALRARVCLSLMAYNTMQLYRTKVGQRLLRVGIRRLRNQRSAEWGASAVVIYIAGSYAVLAVEELLRLLGRPAKDSLLPFGGTVAPSLSPNVCIVGG